VTTPLPHMFFNSVVTTQRKKNCFPSIQDETPDFYFVHSYCVQPRYERHVLARSTYGSEFVSAIGKDLVFGVQFHPEKSQSSGLRLIGDFLKSVARENHG